MGKNSEKQFILLFSKSFHYSLYDLCVCVCVYIYIYIYIYKSNQDLDITELNVLKI